MKNGSEVKFCVDTLLVEAVLSDPKLYKTAGFVSDLLSKVKDYFSSKIDKDNPVTSVLNELAPGAVWMLFQSLGIGKWGFLISMLMEVFHVDVTGILRSLYEKVKEMISSGHKVSSTQIDNAAESTIQEFQKPASEQDAQSGYQKLQQQQQQQQQQQSSSQPADDNRVYSSLELLNDAKMISLALISYEHEKMRLVKQADFESFLKGYSGTRSKGTSLIGSIFGWIIKLALFSAGLMVAGDIIHELLGQPSSLSGTYQAGKDSPAAPAAPPAPRSTQTKFPAKGDSPMPGSWPWINNETNIENMLIQMTKDTYSGLDGKEDLIRSSAAFQSMKDNINWFNVHNPGSAAIFIPKNFKTKKDLVDHFIDDVAKSAP